MLSNSCDVCSSTRELGWHNQQTLCVFCRRLAVARTQSPARRERQERRVLEAFRALQP